MINVIVIIPDNVMATSIMAFLDVLNVTEHTRNQHRQMFSCKLVTLDNEQVNTSQGITFSADTVLTRNLACDVLFFAAPQYVNEETLLAQCKHYLFYQDELLKLCASAEYVVTQCTGVALLAQLGLLKGHSATTSWWLSSYMNTHFEEVALDINQLIHQSGKFITSGATNSAMLLALSIVERYYDSKITEQVAGYLAVDFNQQSQGRFLNSYSLLSKSDSIVSKASQYIYDDKQPVYSVKTLACLCAVTTRTLNRRFHKACGVSPQQFIAIVRIEKACLLLRSTDLSISMISERLGYLDESTLRKAFLKQQGQTMSHYRQVSYKY